jgi:C4-dicarboxylate-specific signal transduction histidine kinase
LRAFTPPLTPLVKVNSLQVTKVLLILIQKAAQAMHEAQMTNGKQWISPALTADGREVCVSVRDQGPGISAASFIANGQDAPTGV